MVKTEDPVMGGMAMTWGKRWVLSEAAVKTAVVPMTVWAKSRYMC